MARLIKIFSLLALPALAWAQQTRPDSLKTALKLAKTDSARFALTTKLVDNYTETQYDVGLGYANQCLQIAQRNNKLLDEAASLDVKGYLLTNLKKYPEALECFETAIKIAEDPGNENKTWTKDKHLSLEGVRLEILANIHHDLGHLMGATNNTNQQIIEYRKTRQIAEKINDEALLGFVNMNLGAVYFKLNRLDSALIMEKNAERVFKQTGKDVYAGDNYKYLSTVYLNLGDIYSTMGSKATAVQYYHDAINSGAANANLSSVGGGYISLARYYLQAKQPDSCIYYAKKTLAGMKIVGYTIPGQIYVLLYKGYQMQKKTDSAYKYQGLALAANDSTFTATVKSLTDFQKVSFKEQLRLRDLEKEKELFQSRARIAALSAGILILLLLATIFYRNNRQKQKANHLLREQKEKIEAQRDNLEKAYGELKSTQTQLIQSEKMASLGELTAGIAHEIQNPLNFVNNFSDVNREMIDELKEELQKGDIEEAIAIANDIQQNEEKINHHGKRADSIIKGMLQHSRASSNTKEPTDINKLADEYLRLAYHGLRAKDKSFNAELVTTFADDLSQIAIVPQDIGRVLLNLFNNAFYAVNQKKKTAGENYKPEVTVTTSTEKSQLMITVKDNGNGIPDNIKEKIMQPFFTTKPTGEGTGLGLSLSYDIVVKGHGGSITLDTKEGEFTEFTITLTLN